jgi:hypothetical protein
MMTPKKLTLCIVICVLIAAALACNLPSSQNNTNQTQNQTNQADDNSEQANNNTQQTADNQGDDTNQTEQEPEPQPETSQLPEFNLADPCGVVSPAVAEEILGMAVEPIEGPGTCIYSNGSASITIGMLSAEDAKLSLASQVLMLQDDCSMSFSYSSDQPDPTPLPPEADPLLAMSMQELLEESIALQTTCAQTEFEALTEYGDGVYVLPFELFMPGGLVSIATDEYTLTILYTDLEMDTAGAVDVALQIFDMVVAGE